MDSIQAHSTGRHQSPRDLDFEVRVTGRVLDGDWHLVRPPRLVTGIVTSLYPRALDIVGIRTDDGKYVDVRVAR